MEALALLRRATEAGLRVEAAGDKLVVRGPKSAEPVVKLLAEKKAEVLAALANTTIEAEPGLSMPCTSRRGHIAELPSGLFSHFCAECGAWKGLRLWRQAARRQARPVVLRRA
jgi:hypothetical protein